MSSVKIRRRCECGCGRITNYGKIWIFGHNGIENIGSKRSEKSKRKMSSSQFGHKLSKESKDKISLAKTGNTYCLGYKHTKETKKKMSNAKKRNWQNPEYQKNQCKARMVMPNKSEITLLKLLNKLYPEEYKYVGDYQFFLGGKNPDFMNINGQKKLLELFGNYWHKGEDPQDRIDHFKQYGFDTLVIWENELKESRLQLRKRLKTFHRG